MRDFTIGTLAKKTEINIETIRFYEKKQLLPTPKRSPSGYRLYTENDVKRLHFITLAKRHGFSLKEIRELLELRIHTESTCQQVREFCETKIQVIELKIGELNKMKRALTTLVAACYESGPAGACPILDVFEMEV